MSIKNNAKKKVYISAKYTDVDLFIKVENKLKENNYGNE